jgi:hypothetical protein
MKDLSLQHQKMATQIDKSTSRNIIWNLKGVGTLVPHSGEHYFGHIIMLKKKKKDSKERPYNSVTISE